MTHEKNTTAIIVTYNSADVIEHCLQSILAAPEIVEIIVVDNCSVDDTCDNIRKHFPTVKVIENPKNEGFGRANNVGIGKVKTDYALLINPDAVLEKNTLTLLLDAAQNYPDAAILAPALYDEQGMLHKSFKQNVFDRENSSPHRGEVRWGALLRGVTDKLFQASLPPVLPPVGGGDLCADFLSGAVWLCNMKHLRTIGFFDKNIFLYYEDDDLCLRVRKAGLGLVYVPQARAVHMMGASSGVSKPEAEYFKQQHLIFSRLYIEEKYRGAAAAKKLAKKLHLEYAAKATWYTLVFNKAKINRYRGRIAGVFAFEERK